MENIKNRKPSLGFWINLADPSVSLMAGLLGFDWVMVDGEHNSMTSQDIQNHIYALSGYRTSCVIRARGNRPEEIKWILDSGAAGIIIPSIIDSDDARQSVQNCKYHPLGNRGYGPNRTSGFMYSEQEYIKNANRDILLICQIELKSSLEEAEEICRIPGIDGIWIGPADLAHSLGHIGNPSHPEVSAAIQKIIDTANRCGMPWGMPCSVDRYPHYASQRGTILSVGSDTSLLRTGMLGIRERLQHIAPL